MLRCRKLNITLVSADNLPNVRKNGRMKVYAKVSLNGKSNTSQKTHVDREGETNPRWYVSFDYTINEAAVRSAEAGTEVVVKLYCDRFYGDRYIGEVKMAVKSLFDGHGGVIGSEKAVSFGVGGTRQGRLNILYSFGGMFLVPQPQPSIAGARSMNLVQLLARGVWFVFTGDTGDWVHLIGN